MVKGYVLTVPREGLAQIPILNKTSEGNDPIFAYWNYGLGKSAVFTSDLSGRWGGAWPAWGGFQGMWERTIRWLMRPATPSNVTLKTTMDGEEATVELEALDDKSGLMNFMRTDAKVVRPDGSLATLALEQVAPGRYRGKFSASETGSYLVDIGLLDANGSRSGGSIQGAVSMAYPREFRTSRDNSALMREVAEATGGRVLTSRDLAVTDLFERKGLSQPESVRRIWDILAIIAAALLVIDVAVRRLVFDSQSARDIAQQAFGGARGTGGEMVAAWKKARQRTEVDSSDAASDTPSAQTTGIPRQIDRISLNRPDAGKSGAGSSPASGSSNAPSADADADPESPMERLRRAKKRAQDGQREQGDEEKRT